MKSVFQKNQILIFYLFISLLNGSFVFGQNESRVNGTTGTPLGGFGAGAVKFNANNGTFAIMTRPPADAYDFKAVRNARLQFFCKRGSSVKTVDVLKAKVVNGRPEDDAIWPLHKVDFGTPDDIQVNMTGFSPLDNVQYDNMCLPYAFYELTLSNTARKEATAAAAFQWDDGENAFSYVAGKGVAGKTAAVFASSNDSKALITAGDALETEFAKEGKCNNIVNSSQAKVAVCVTLKPGETKTVRFILAWYEYSDPELAYYFNLYKSPRLIANQGLKQFDKLKANAETLVNKFRASNLPDWLKNQTLNTLVNLTVNSMYKKDGRVGFAEGQWTCFGTMDQMWHARQIVGQLVPFYAWQELRYWARTQMKNGQIHHDFNKMDGESAKEKRSALVGWDDTEHVDYRNVLKWADLNCAFITSTYETYQMTGDKSQFDYLWPYLKKAAQRILDQVEQYGSKEYPYTFDHSENSYDAGGDPNPFNANFSVVAYKVMIILAKEKGEIALVEKYQKAYDAVVNSFADRYLNNKNFRLGKHCESFYGGQWLAFNMKLGEIWSVDNTDFVLNKLDEYYHPYYLGLGNEKGSYDEWTPYILTHYGGLLLNTNRANQWEVMQKDAYNRQYMNRDKVFDHALNILPLVKEPKWIATNISGDKQYISIPAIWRNYYDIIGYYRDMRTKELWIKPILPGEVNHKMTDAMFVSPEGYGSISCTESGTYSQNKDIVVKPDNPIFVSTLYLADNFGQNVTITIDGKKYSFERKGSGYARELAVKWNGKIDNKGIHIIAGGDPGMPAPALPAKPVVTAQNTLGSTLKLNPFDVIEAESAPKSAGVKIAKFQQGGAYVTSCNNFDYIQFSNVDFGQIGATEFCAKVASPLSGTAIEIVLDDVAGELIGTCPVNKTGDFQTWSTMSCPISKTKGVHDVILRFTGATSGDLINLDKIIFSEKRGQGIDPFKINR
jgi:Predicted bile acid beta-glucosidase